MKQNKITKEEIQNMKENIKSFLQINTMALTQKEKEVINNLTKEDYRKMPSLAEDIMNAHFVNNAIRRIKKLNNTYNTDLITLKTISPKLFEECKNHIGYVEDTKIPSSEELKEEINKLRANNIHVNKDLLWCIHDYHKGVKALKESNKEELGKLIGVVIYIITTQGGIEPIRQIIDVCREGARQKIYQRRNKKSYGELKY